MSRSRAFVASIAIVAALGAAPAAGPGRTAPFVGRWEATVVVNQVEVPFRFDIEPHGGALTGVFFNGDRRIESTGSHVDEGVLTLDFDQYATKLRVSAVADTLTGEYQRAKGAYAFKAVRFVEREAAPEAAVPAIGGVWVVKARSRKGETAWRFIVEQRAADVSATILRVDGDTGTLSGRYRDGRFVLSHFSGVRPLVLDVIPQADGTLTLRENETTELVAAREDAPEAAAFGAPSDPAAHTRMKDPSAPFQFSFPDLDGHLVSSTDARFAGKVILVSVGGSWCPNCHDEAPFLAGLYRRYRAQGLEIVSLSFEEADQLVNPTRLRAFIASYGIEYPVLLAGEPDELAAKVPQADHLDAFPTTFVIGRDGRVREVHAGFPSPGSGEFYTSAVADLTGEVERLLAEPEGIR